MTVRIVGHQQWVRAYASRELLKRKLRQGYTQVRYGSGQWVGDHGRILAVFAFLHPDGRIATYEHGKMEGSVGQGGMSAPPVERRYTAERFKQWRKYWQVGLTRWRSLARLLKHWQGRRRVTNSESPPP